jgi:serine/threonine protein kinase
MTDESIRRMLGQVTAGEVELASVGDSLRTGISRGLLDSVEVDGALLDAVRGGTLSRDAYQRLTAITRQEETRAPTALHRDPPPSAPVVAETALAPGRRKQPITDPGTKLRPSREVPADDRDLPPTMLSHSRNVLQGTDAPLSDPHAWTGVWGEELNVGDVLSERYRLERKLGEGGMGVVYLALDLQDKERPFAVKVLKSDFRRDPTMVKLLEEEVDKGRKLTHPNIVAVYLLMRHRTHLFVLMQYLEGKTLEQLLTDDFARGMPYARAEALIRGAGTALAYAHDSGVIHSDLKPSNIFVTTAGVPKVLDFGIARAVRGNSGTIGELEAFTEAYASCHLLERQRPEIRDDIYAFGCVVYELLTGQHPFESCNRNALVARDKQFKPKPVAGLRPHQNRALLRALEFDREQRTASVEELLGGLDTRTPAAWLRRGWPVAAGLTLVAGAGSLVWLERDSLLSRSADARFVESLLKPTAARADDYDPSEVKEELEHAAEELRLGAKPFNAVPLSTGASTAYGSFQNVLREDPSNRTAAEGILAILKLYRGEAARLAGLGQSAPALELVGDGLEINPNDPTLLALKQRLEK